MAPTDNDEGEEQIGSDDDDNDEKKEEKSGKKDLSRRNLAPWQ